MKKDEKQEKKSESGELKIPSMTDDEIKQLAEDMYKGIVFTDRHIQRGEDIQSVFAVLALMEQKQIDILRKNPPGMIYEYMDRAGPMAVNGMPIFFSFKMASVDDAKKIIERYNNIREAVAKV